MHVFSAITAQTPFFSSANFMGKLCYRFIAIIKKVQINADEFKMLLRHPYLSYEQVKSIVNYRNELGGLNDLQELQQLEGFNAEDTTRLKPYISFQKK